MRSEWDTIIKPGWLNNFTIKKQSGNHYQCLCTNHDDKNASLTISYEGGKWLFYCHAGCDTKDVLKAAGLKLSDISTEPKPEPKPKKSNIKQLPKRIEKEYNYTDENGNLLYQAVRFVPKDFRQRRPDGKGGWEWNLKGIELVPYNLPNVLKSDLVLVVEGEKDVENLRKVGITATCNPMGAGKWRSEFNQYFKGKNVIIIPDNDVPGRDHAGKVFKHLEPFAKSVRVVDLPSDEYKDVSDYIAAGRDVKKLLVQPKPEAKPKIDTVQLRHVYNPYKDTHLGNAERLIEFAGEDIRFVQNIGWFAWNGQFWESGDHTVSEMYKNIIVPQLYAEIEERRMAHDDEGERKLKSWAKRSESAGIMRETIGMAATAEKVRVNNDEFDKDPMLLNCENGTINLHDGELMPFERSDYITKMIPIRYDKNAQCPRWEQFLQELFPDQDELINWIQRAVGYCLTGSVSEQVMFFLTGCGRNGKSVFMNTIMALLGQYACETPTETLMTRFGVQQTIGNDLARLPGMRLVSANETEHGQRLAEAKVKAMTGGDTITARFLHKEFFDFKPVFKLWLRSNHKPVIRGTDEGIWRRVRLIPFMENFEGREDKNLQEKLIAELPGILQWAINGCLDWQEIGLDMPKEVETATQQYRSSQDVVGLFLDECITANSSTCNLSVKCSSVYDVYKFWCEDAGERALSQRKLNEAMTEKGYVRRRMGSEWQFYWEGMTLTR